MRTEGIGMSDPIAELAATIGEGGLITDRDVVSPYRADQTEWVAAGTPAAVVLAHGVEDVVATLVWATRHHIPIVPRGAGSGLSGGASAVDGCVVLSLERMDRILEVDPENQTALVEPGVINADVGRASAQHDLWYPPDPASFEFSTIGGNVATNAGGLCCVKYGVTGDHVLGLEVVLTDGSVIWTGRRTVKGVAGYDLTNLFVGSEGTLGVVTKALLRLRRRRKPGPICLALFRTLRSAGQAVTGILRETEPYLLEIMDRRCIRAVEEWKGVGLDPGAEAMLLAQLEEHDAVGIGLVEGACAAAGASSVAVSTDEFEAEQLLTVRRLTYPALERLGPTLLDDVAVPRSELVRFIAGVSEISEDLGVEIATFGHAGDGNLHPTILYQRSVEGRAAAGSAFSRVVDLAIEVGGTCTGEHGVGSLKIPFLVREQGERVIDLQRGLKRVFDPMGVLNPGKGIA
jgi:glycolate oxidase